MKSTLHIALAAVALAIIGFLVQEWRSARQDSAKFNTTLAQQNAAMQQLQGQEKQRDSQLATALASIAAEKLAVKTPQQAAQAIPSVLPPLPIPISIQVPDLSPKTKPDQQPPATISIPQVDLQPLYNGLQDSRASALEDETIKNDLADEQARIAAVIQERDAAIATSKGGPFWTRVKRSAKWFIIGAAAGAVMAVGTHR